MEPADKKTKIIETVERLLMEKGSSTLSVREIAKAANINIAMISYYFGSKEQVIEAVVTYRYQTEQKNFLENYQKIKTEKDIKLRIGKIIDLYAEKTFYFKSLQQVTEENPSIVLNCRPAIIDFHMALVEIFEEPINEGIKEGLFTLKTDIKMLVGSIIGTLTFFVKSRVFVQEFISKNIPAKESQEYINTKIRNHLKTMIFLMLGNE